MKEIICWLLPVLIVFLLIGLLESAMLFEQAQEDYSLSPSRRNTFER